MDGIYLDHNATTPVDPRVVEAMRPHFSDGFGNASSTHAWGQAARGVVDEARRMLADLLGCSPPEVVFTSGGTEADNLAVQGVGRACGFEGHIVVSAIEHKATLASAKVLDESGMRVTRVPAGPDGVVDPEAVALAIQEDTRLVSVMLANNETGAVQPAGEIARIAHEHGALYHCDAVQAFGKIGFDLDGTGADLLALSAHKIYGPKGIGLLYVREGTGLAPLITGGSQERGQRGGTTNVPLVAGFAEAARIALSDRPAEAARLKMWSELFLEGVRAQVPDVRVFSRSPRRLPGTVNLGFKGLDGSLMTQALDMAGLAVSTGSACEAGSTEPSHVLKGMGIPDEEAVTAVRFSFGRLNDADQVERAVALVARTTSDLRGERTAVGG